MSSPARYWREMPQRYRYEAARCDQCGKTFFPPRLICNGCSGRSFSKTVLSTTGRVQTFTIIRVPPAGFGDEAPYAVGIVQLDDGPSVTAQIVDCDLASLEIGDRVRLEFRRVQQDGESGVIYYGYKFVPVG